jgi:hypothetical protein
MDSSAQPLDDLRGFRNSLYRCFERRADALFELTDALLSAAGTVPSPVHLSLASAHRRGWGSLYAALSRGHIEEDPLRELLARHASTGEASHAPVYAVDVSVWSRCDAETSPGRGYYYHPSRHSAGQPIVAGWAYQLIAGLSFQRDSWVAPTDARRLRPEEDANEVAVAQVKDLLRRPPGTGGAVPLFVFDAGYDPVKLQRGLESSGAHVLVRLHSNRAFYADPEEVESRPVGRPRRHGSKFALPDPESWPEPASEHRCLTRNYGEVRVRAWSGLHPKTRRIAERYGCQRAPVVRGTVILVEVSKLPRQSRKPKKLWLWWHGEGEPDLDLLWRAYVRRFDLEHTIRFLKQTLGWTTPRVRHPEQADRWTWLVLLAYAQLGLARSCADDSRLPWEHPQLERRLTPCRTLRGFAALLAALSTPARAPKPCGRSPGRPKGRLSGRAQRYPALKKAA